jgi:hypothetical protein
MNATGARLDKSGGTSLTWYEEETAVSDGPVVRTLNQHAQSHRRDHKMYRIIKLTDG